MKIARVLICQNRSRKCYSFFHIFFNGWGQKLISVKLKVIFYWYFTLEFLPSNPSLILFNLAFFSAGSRDKSDAMIVLKRCAWLLSQRVRKLKIWRLSQNICWSLCPWWPWRVLQHCGGNGKRERGLIQKWVVFLAWSFIPWNLAKEFAWIMQSASKKEWNMIGKPGLACVQSYDTKKKSQRNGTACTKII